MDPLDSLHKSTISPSGSDLCPVRDACNWGQAVVALLGVVRMLLYMCSYIQFRCEKCWHVSSEHAVSPADKSWITSPCCTLFPPSLSSFLSSFPFTLSAPPPPSWRGFTIHWKGWTVCESHRIQSRRRELGKDSARHEMLILMWFRALLKLTQNDGWMSHNRQTQRSAENWLHASKSELMFWCFWEPVAEVCIQTVFLQPEGKAISYQTINPNPFPLKNHCIHIKKSLSIILDILQYFTRLQRRDPYLWLIPIGVEHHPPLRAVIAVAETELLHEDFVLTVLPPLDD